MDMKHVAILLAGGSGSRMGASVEDKVLVDLAGQPAFSHVLEAFNASGTQDALVVVARDDRQRKQLVHLVKNSRTALPVFFTIGGRERQDSVRAGLDMVPTGAEWVTIHDCARPAITPRALQAVRKALLATHGPVSLAHRVVDTIRSFDQPPIDTPHRGQLLDRSRLWAMETPQAFPRSLLERAHAALTGPVTDDIGAVEALGEPVLLVESLTPNPKLTRPADLALLESILSQNLMTDTNQTRTRTGFGYDIHRLEAGLPLILGGVRIPSSKGLVGHSDADVLSHAIADAILGAAGLPDIGHYFPNTDDSIAGISSQEILRRARDEARKAGLHLINVDATLIAEAPKIAPHIARMKTILAQTLQIEPGDIGIKATTNEKIGSLGREDGMAAQAVATLQGARRRRESPQA